MTEYLKDNPLKERKDNKYFSYMNKGCILELIKNNYLNTSDYIVLLYCLSHIDYMGYGIIYYNNQNPYNLYYSTDTSLWLIDYKNRKPLSNRTFRRSIDKLIELNILYNDKENKRIIINPYFINRGYVERDTLNLFSNTIWKEKGFAYGINKNIPSLKLLSYNYYLFLFGLKNPTLKFISQLSANSFRVMFYIACNLESHSNLFYNRKKKLGLKDILEKISDISRSNIYGYIKELNEMDIIQILPEYDEIYFNPNIIFRKRYILNTTYRLFRYNRLFLDYFDENVIANDEEEMYYYENNGYVYRNYNEDKMNYINRWMEINKCRMNNKINKKDISMYEDAIVDNNYEIYF